jgi:hypothetical protein
MLFKDELDKTLAEYDTNNINLKENNNFADKENNSGLLTINKKKLVANDANAASIRTRYSVFFIINFYILFLTCKID